MSVEKIPVLGRKLGVPPQALELLKEALTHRTYAVEHHLNYDNQRLEFLGDAVLEIIHTEFLYHRYPESPEGDLTKIRSALACESMLAGIARELHLGEYLLIGNGEKDCGGNDRDSTLCDLFEAVLGALYLACGMEKTREFVHRCFARQFADPRRMLNDLNPKGRLQEFSQSRWHVTPQYILCRSGGPHHAPFFEVEARIDRYRATGYGNSRKSAEVAAAGVLLKFFSRHFKF
ncbi:MAG: ribonuclease III [Lentisphaeria bacterium]|nr:ribonuclease III [Lentisphaeria bacterium]